VIEYSRTNRFSREVLWDQSIRWRCVELLSSQNNTCGRFAAVVTNPAINPTIEVRSYMGVVIVRVREYLSVPFVNVP